MGPLDIWEHRAHLILHFRICICIIHLDILNNSKSNNKKKVYNAQNKYLISAGFVIFLSHSRLNLCMHTSNCISRNDIIRSYVANIYT